MTEAPNNHKYPDLADQAFLGALKRLDGHLPEALHSSLSKLHSQGNVHDAAQILKAIQSQASTSDGED